LTGGAAARRLRVGRPAIRLIWRTRLDADVPPSAGGMQRGRAAGPLAKIVRVTHTSCGPSVLAYHGVTTGSACHGTAHASAGRTGTPVAAAPNEVLRISLALISPCMTAGTPAARKPQGRGPQRTSSTGLQRHARLH